MAMIEYLHQVLEVLAMGRKSIIINLSAEEREYLETQTRAVPLMKLLIKSTAIEECYALFKQICRRQCGERHVR